MRLLLVSSLWAALILTAPAFGADEGTNRLLKATPIQTVYVMPMGNGLDQYMANRLTSEGIFEVVTDPKLADAVFTDQIGKGFEQRLDDMKPAPPPEPAASDSAKEEEKGAKKADSAIDLGGVAYHSAPPVYASTFSRGRGNIFLVELKNRRVVWSTFERPVVREPREMNKLSVRIVNRLRQDLLGR